MRILELSVAIISWNDRENLRVCLSSLSAIDSGTTEIIVVDNGSKDGTAEMVTNEFPGVKLIVNKHNRGVARARNQAIAVAQGDFYLILDSDAVVRENAVASMLDFIKSKPDAGLTAPRLVGTDGKTELTSRCFPTLWTVICRRLDRFGFFRHSPELRHQMMTDWDHRTARRVDYVIGACQLIRREAWEEVGPLDERIFFGPEDIDFCLRLKLSGWRVTYYPQAVVEHVERRPTRSVFTISHWLHVWGILYFFNKHRYLLSHRRALKYFTLMGIRDTCRRPSLGEISGEKSD
jgi:GT2 family glycosyltransferase